MNWSLIQEPGVMDTIENVAKSVANKYELTLYAVDDLVQEASVIVASKPQYVELVFNDPTHLRSTLWQDVVDLVRPEARRSNKNTSYEAAREWGLAQEEADAR